MDIDPAPFMIDSWQAAEENAAAWMRRWGFPDAAVTAGGPDGGVDVRAEGALAQVKFEAAQVGAPTVQRLVGARGLDHHTTLMLFSGAGFARPAVVYADTMGVALFKYDLLGRMTCANEAADAVVQGRTDRATAIEWLIDSEGNLDPTQYPDVMCEYNKGKPINAIALLRQQSGASLRDAAAAMKGFRDRPTPR